MSFHYSRALADSLSVDNLDGDPYALSSSIYTLVRSSWPDLALGVSASGPRAIETSTTGVSTRSGASGGRGGGDHVASLSQGAGGGQMPVNVTVILGVDQVSRVLVDGSRREARAGSMSGNRLAVA